MARTRVLLRVSLLAAAALTAWGRGAVAQAAPHVDPTWLKSDSATSTAELTLIAGLGNTNGGMNFNGTSNGALTLTVPAGWHVVLHFRNQDQIQPHSAVVIARTDPVPTGHVSPVFERATTRNAEQGLAPDARGDVAFVAARAGRFLIFCAVPGHGAAGMWLNLEVSASATHASLVAGGPRGS